MITNRDIEVLNWVGEMYGIRVDLLCWLLGRSAGAETVEPGLLALKTVERRVTVWKKDELVERAKIFYGEPAWVWLTNKGLGLLEHQYKLLRPKLTTLKHIHAVNQVRLWLEQQGLEMHWRSERRLKFEWNRDEHSKKWHVPDAELITETDRIAIEIELTPKTAQETKKILVRLANHHREYTKICYYTRPACYKVLSTQLETIKPSERARFELYHLDEITSQFR